MQNINQNDLDKLLIELQKENAQLSIMYDKNTTIINLILEIKRLKQETQNGTDNQQNSNA